MQVLIRVADDSAEEIRSLRNWLADESSVRQFGHLREASEPAPTGRMLRVQRGNRSVEIRTNDLGDVKELARQLEESLADEPEAG